MVPGSPRRYVFGAFGAHPASVPPLANRFFWVLLRGSACVGTFRAYGVRRSRPDHPCDERGGEPDEQHHPGGGAQERGERVVHRSGGGPVDVGGQVVQGEAAAHLHREPQQDGPDREPQSGRHDGAPPVDGDGDGRRGQDHGQCGEPDAGDLEHAEAFPESAEVVVLHDLHGQVRHRDEVGEGHAVGDEFALHLGDDGRDVDREGIAVAGGRARRGRPRGRRGWPRPRRSGRRGCRRRSSGLRRAGRPPRSGRGRRRSARRGRG